MQRHELLQRLHIIINPEGYLEIGVQTGASLILARQAQVAVGVDPDWTHLAHDVDFAVKAECTSDEFFDSDPLFLNDDGSSFLDLVFIDGLHHSDQVLRDVANAMKVGHPGTIYVLDDVLPRNQGEASRIQCPGDWTGDVYRAALHLVGIMEDERDAGFEAYFVDTEPTGTMVIFGTAHSEITELITWDADNVAWHEETPVPEDILTRKHAVTPDHILAMTESWMSWKN